MYTDAEFLTTVFVGDTEPTGSGSDELHGYLFAGACGSVSAYNALGYTCLRSAQAELTIVAYHAFRRALDVAMSKDAKTLAMNNATQQARTNLATCLQFGVGVHSARNSPFVEPTFVCGAAERSLPCRSYRYITCEDISDTRWDSAMYLLAQVLPRGHVVYVWNGSTVADRLTGSFFKSELRVVVGGWNSHVLHQHLAVLLGKSFAPPGKGDSQVLHQPLLGKSDSSPPQWSLQVRVSCHDPKLEMTLTRFGREHTSPKETIYITRTMATYDISVQLRLGHELAHLELPQQPASFFQSFATHTNGIGETTIGGLPVVFVDESGRDMSTGSLDHADPYWLFRYSETTKENKSVTKYGYLTQWMNRVLGFTTPLGSQEPSESAQRETQHQIELAKLAFRQRQHDVVEDHDIPCGYCCEPTPRWVLTMTRKRMLCRWKLLNLCPTCLYSTPRRRCAYRDAPDAPPCNNLVSSDLCLCDAHLD